MTGRAGKHEPVSSLPTLATAVARREWIVNGRDPPKLKAAAAAKSMAAAAAAGGEGGAEDVDMQEAEA
jgi:hypothetical protein